MYESTRKGTKETMVAIAAALFRYGSLVACRKAVGTVLDRAAWLDSKSRSDIMKQAMGVARVGLLIKKDRLAFYVAYNLDEVMKAWNRAWKRTWVRTRKTSVMSGMKIQRGREDPVVFYLVSSHQKPQPAHKDLQGKVLVDYYWRDTLEGDDRIGLVGKYVRNRKIRTVQWAMGEPHYLLVRPNCAHRLIPLKTDDVLTMDIKSLKNKYKPSSVHVHRPISDETRWQEYVALRRTVLAEAKKKTGG